MTILGLPTELFVSFCAVVIAACALALAFLEAWWTRRHHRLSARPLLHFTARCDPTGEIIGICLSNKGVGPAILCDMRYFVGKIGLVTDPMGQWPQVIRALGLSVPLRFYGLPVPDDRAIIQIGEELELLAVPTEGRTSEELEEVVTAMERISLVVYYESIYGEKQMQKFRGEALRETWLQGDRDESAQSN